MKGVSVDATGHTLLVQVNGFDHASESTSQRSLTYFLVATNLPG